MAVLHVSAESCGWVLLSRRVPSHRSGAALTGSRQHDSLPFTTCYLLLTARYFKLGRIPTTGLLAIAVAINSCDSVDVYGYGNGGGGGKYDNACYYYYRCGGGSKADRQQRLLLLLLRMTHDHFYFLFSICVPLMNIYSL